MSHQPWLRCRGLAAMCNLGMTVVAVVHQPRFSLFQMFDCVLMLGRDKRLVYAGPTAFTTHYFSRLGYEPQLQVSCRPCACQGCCTCSDNADVRHPDQGVVFYSCCCQSGHV
jgi:hypothetical protein